MKIITYNINGIRAAIAKGFAHWLAEENPDIICLQEVKAHPEQVDLDFLTELGYHFINWRAAQKKGYSGVASFSKIEPSLVIKKIGIEKYDDEGRFLRLDFPDFTLINSYFPSGSSGEHRQVFKYEYLTNFYDYLIGLRKTYPNILLCGDVNICHREIDIHNPKANQNTSGFLPEERAWMTELFGSGFSDAFRLFNPDPHHYTWWSYRAGARKKNLGWRIDYFIVSDKLQSRLNNCHILSHATHSDHCPVVLEMSH